MRLSLAPVAFAALLLAIVSFAAVASPLTTIGSPAETFASHISLLQRVLIYGKEGSSKLVDGRWNLGQSEAKLGIKFSAEETKQLMACTGEIVCATPDIHNEDEDRLGMKVTASAVSVLRPDLLVTAKHVFFKGKKAAVPFGSCSFRSFSRRNVAIPVLVEKDQRKGYVFNNEDFIVLRLKRELEGCKSFAVTASDSFLREGEQVLSVTGQQAHTLNKLSRREPTVATGKIRNVFNGFFGGPPFYYADIDFDVGGSGSAVFALADGRPVADDEGRLILRGLSVAFGPRARNGKPYSDTQNYTIVIGLQGDFRDLVKGKANRLEEAEPARCLPGEAANIEVMSEPVAKDPTETLSPALQHYACGGDAKPGHKAGKVSADCAQLTQGLKLAASRRGPQKQEFKLRNDTSCPICFSYERCNDYGCWTEAAQLGSKSTLAAGMRVGAPVVKNPQFCKAEPAPADMAAPLAPSKPNQPQAAEAGQNASEADAVFLAAKEKARREGVETLTADDIRGLSLEQIRALRGY